MSGKFNPLLRPVVRVELTLALGEVLTRDFLMHDADVHDWAAPPSWVENPSKSWDHPQDPVTMRGTVKVGHEDEARAAMASPDTETGQQ